MTANGLLTHWVELREQKRRMRLGERAKKRG